MLKKRIEMEETLTGKIYNFSPNNERKAWEIKFKHNWKHKFKVQWIHQYKQNLHRLQAYDVFLQKNV